LTPQFVDPQTVRDPLPESAHTLAAVLTDALGCVLFGGHDRLGL
jgi:hypothetical protein